MSKLEPVAPPTDRVESRATETLLAGGGEMGARMRAHDWASTPLGPAENWPQSLKTAVRIMLTSRQPIWIGWGSELIYLYNDPYKSIIGGKHPWALGRSASVVWREIWDDIGPMLATAMKGDEGTYVEEQLLIMERNGYPEETYYTFSYSPIPDDDGRAGGIICANTDDTQRVIGERQLSLLRALAAGIIEARTLEEVCEQSGHALGTNPHDLPFAMIYMAEPGGRSVSLAGMCGIERGHPAAPASIAVDGRSAWPVADVLGKHEPRLVSDLAEAFGELPTGAWRARPSQAAMLPIHAAGETGRAGVLIVALNPFRLFDDGYRAFLGLVAGQIAAAISRARAFEEERKRAEAFAEIDRAKTIFFSNVSHEFRTPLTLMLGPLEAALSAADLPEPHRNELSIAHRNSLRLLRLVNTLLDFSRVEAGRMQASYEPVDLAALTAELASNFRSACQKAGLALVVDCAVLPQTVLVDREMWEKIVLNLISNAFKFTLEGGIEVRLSAADAGAQLSVRDTGTGIARHELPRIFERFHRIEGTRGRTHEGTGIGLALVQELVRLHGGTITAESEIDRGSTFTVAIPFGADHLPIDRIGGGRQLISTAVRTRAFVDEALRWLPDGEPRDDAPFIDKEIAFQPRHAASIDGPPPRVLVVDDNADMRGYIRGLLQGAYGVAVASDGSAALEAIAAQRPDLVLTDIMMPGLDGFGLLRAVRADPALRDIPVIMLSARAGEEAHVEGFDAGADDYLVKPFSARELLARVGAHLQMAQIRREALEAVQAREQELHARAMQLDVIMSTVPAAIWLAEDPQATRITGSRHANEMLRLPPDANHSKSAPPDERPATFRVMKNGRELPAEALPVQRACRGEVVRLEELDLVFDDGSVVHEIMNAAPVRDAEGRVIGAVGASINITERKRAEDALRESEARLRFTLEAGRLGSWELDLETGELFASKTCRANFGRGPEVPFTYQDLRDAIHPDDREMMAAAVEGSISRRSDYDIEYRVVSPGDGVRWVAIRGRTIYAEDGAPLRMVGVSLDVTARKRAEEGRRESEERFRTLADNMPAMCWMADAGGSMFWYNARWYEYTGTTPMDQEGWGWQSVHHPDVLPSVVERWKKSVATGEPFEMTFPLKGADGVFRPFLTRVVPLRDESGRIVRWFGTNTDVTEQQRYQQRLRVMIDELNHRVKNTLATVQSIATQTMRHAPSQAEFLEGFVSRLMALSRAHDLLTRGSWQAASLMDVVQQTLEPYGAGKDRIEIGGPTVRLCPSVAVTLNMTFHELATNAAKYGALSAPGGKLAIRWRLDPSGVQPVLQVDWTERGGPKVAPPERRGFGSRLIERGIAQELDGEVSLDFAADGLQCCMRLPVSERISVS